MITLRIKCCFRCANCDEYIDDSFLFNIEERFDDPATICCQYCGDELVEVIGISHKKNMEDISK